MLALDVWILFDDDPSRHTHLIFWGGGLLRNDPVPPFPREPILQDKRSIQQRVFFHLVDYFFPWNPHQSKHPHRLFFFRSPLFRTNISFPLWILHSASNNPCCRSEESTLTIHGRPPGRMRYRMYQRVSVTSCQIARCGSGGMAMMTLVRFGYCWRRFESFAAARLP